MSWFIFALASAVLLATATLIEKKTLFREHAMEFASTVALFNAILSLPLFFFADFSRFNWQIVLAIYLASLAGTVSFYLLAKANRHMQVSETSALLVTAPAFAATLGFIFLNERLNLWQISGLLLVIFGAYVLETRHLSNILQPFRRFEKSLYVKLIGAVLLLYAIGTLFDRIVFAQIGINIYAFLILMHFFIGINSFILLSAVNDGWFGIKHAITKAGWPIFIVSIVTILHRASYAFAISGAFIGLVTAIKRSSVLFTILIGGELFKEKKLGRKFTATIIMLLGIFLLTIK